MLLLARELGRRDLSIPLVWRRPASLLGNQKKRPAGVPGLVNAMHDHL
jgi:hypothetical protein